MCNIGNNNGKTRQQGPLLNVNSIGLYAHCSFVNCILKSNNLLEGIIIYVLFIISFYICIHPSVVRVVLTESSLKAVNHGIDLQMLTKQLRDINYTKYLCINLGEIPSSISRVFEAYTAGVINISVSLTAFARGQYC